MEAGNGQTRAAIQQLGPSLPSRLAVLDNTLTCPHDTPSYTHGASRYLVGGILYCLAPRSLRISHFGNSLFGGLISSACSILFDCFCLHDTQLSAGRTPSELARTHRHVGGEVANILYIALIAHCIYVCITTPCAKSNPVFP